MVAQCAQQREPPLALRRRAAARPLNPETRGRGRHVEGQEERQPGSDAAGQEPPRAHRRQPGAQLRREPDGRHEAHKGCHRQQPDHHNDGDDGHRQHRQEDQRVEAGDGDGCAAGKDEPPVGAPRAARSGRLPQPQPQEQIAGRHQGDGQRMPHRGHGIEERLRAHARDELDRNDRRRPDDAHRQVGAARQSRRALDDGLELDAALLGLKVAHAVSPKVLPRARRPHALLCNAKRRRLDTPIVVGARLTVAAGSNGKRAPRLGGRRRASVSSVSGGPAGRLSATYGCLPVTA